MRVAHENQKPNNFWMGCDDNTNPRRRQHLKSKNNDLDGEYEDSSMEPRVRPRTKPKSSESEEVMDDYDPDNEDYYLESSAIQINQFSKTITIIIATIIFTLNLCNLNFYS